MAVSLSDKKQFCKSQGGEWLIPSQQCEIKNVKLDVFFESPDGGKTGKLALKDTRNKVYGEVVAPPKSQASSDGVPPGFARMNEKIEETRENKAPIRIGGAGASGVKTDVKVYMPGDKTTDVFGGSRNTAAYKPGNLALGEAKLGTTCTAEEIALSPWSWAYIDKLADFGKIGKFLGLANEKDVKKLKGVDEKLKKIEEEKGISVKAKGPNVSIDPLCVNPVELVKQGPKEGVENSFKKLISDVADAIVNNEVIKKAGTDYSDAPHKRREKEAGL